jgi:putative ABC transport system substrate-binding protein
MNRRAFVTGLGAVLAAPLAAEAQQGRKLYRLGYLGLTTLAAVRDLVEALRRGLKEVGLIEGQNIQIDFRWAEGRSDRLARLAEDLVRQHPDVLVAPTSQGIQAMRAATRSIPIVMVASNDPVSDGLVASLSRPGGNITGLMYDPGLDIGGKHVELLRQAVPKLSRIAALGNPANPSYERMTEAVRAGTRSFGLQAEFLEARSYEEVKSALGVAAASRAGAMVVFSDGTLYGQRRQIVEFGLTHRLPVICPWREAAEVGGFMAYGASLADNFRRAAGFVDRILKGARPGDLPVELPTKFELVINLKTAKAIGLTIPPSLLLRADQAIE